MRAMPRPTQPLPTSIVLVWATRRVSATRLVRATSRLRQTGLVCAIALAFLAGLAVPGAAEGPAGAMRAPVPGAVQRSLKSFASGWMAKLQRAEAADQRASKDASAGLTYTGYGDSFTTEIKSAGRSYVGLLRYHEYVYRCAGRGGKSCRAITTVPVTEIFRFQDGRWVY